MCCLFIGLFLKVANANGTAWPSASSVQKYVDMGFPEEMVLKAMKDNGSFNNHLFSFVYVIGDLHTLPIRLLLLLSGDNSADSLIELLLTYQVFIYTAAFIRNSLMTLLRACKIICIYK